MGWIGLLDADTALFDMEGIDGTQGPGSAEVLLPCGSLVVEFRLPSAPHPASLVSYRRGGAWPYHLSIGSAPGGVLTLAVDQGGTRLHGTINVAEFGRSDVLRLTFSWDAPARTARLSVERPGCLKAETILLASPHPMPAEDAAGLIDLSRAHVSENVTWLALSSEIEPVGPMPGLGPDTTIARQNSQARLRDLRRGDLVRSSGGGYVPVLRVVSRRVPARGSFRPLRLRSPYFGLAQDLVVAPDQRLFLAGAEVDYLFGREEVLVSAGDLSGRMSVCRDPAPSFVTYSQLLLPANEALIASGVMVESFFVGRLRRDKTRLEASLLAGLDRSRLPEHVPPACPVLNPYDAAVLADFRAA